jgi:hypothetical protein
MPNNAVEIKRTYKLPEWRMSADGKKKTLGGRWNMQRVEEILIESRHKRFTMDDLARLVYGSTNQTNRDNVRKHIPAQRNYMLAKLIPFATTYGARGRIESIKLYEADEPEDRIKLDMELKRMEDRSEISTERAEKLRQILCLPRSVS